MSRLYDTVEPSVINDAILKSAVEEQGPKLVAGVLAKEEGISYEDVTSLRLDFKNILKVDNLWQFSLLVKLQLDNNIIEQIEGLETLVNLKWLDLSFNNIEVIEGLEKLTKLEDLTLFNNRISFLENMEALKDLHIFSIGNNKLQGLEQMIYLRRFDKLRTLNMSGNPLCEDPNYRLFAIAYLSHLVYLDFRLVDADTRNKAHALYENKLGELMHHEYTEKMAQEAEERMEAAFELHQSAYVERLDGDYLFEAMYSDDPEGQKLHKLPGMEETINDFRKKFTVLCRKIFEYGLTEHTRRTTEVETFFNCMHDAKNANKDLAVTDIENFLMYQKCVFRDILLVPDPEAQEEKTNEYNAKVCELWDTLMGYEMRLVDQLEETINNFERNLADLIATFTEHIQGLVSTMRELENTHNEKLLEGCIVILEKVVKNESEIELSEDLRVLFVDKDTVVNAVAASHDVHLLNIDNREDEMVTRSGSWMANLMQKIHREEVHRNRNRVEEISIFIDHMRDEIDQLEIAEPETNS